MGLVMVSCNSGSAEAEETPELSVEEQKVEELKAQVMELHDKTMAQNPQLGQLTTKLKAAAKESADTAVFYNAYMDLAHAHEDMMGWMHNFKNPDDMAVGPNEKIEYLQAQKDKMAQISEYTDKSISQAEEILGSL